MFVLTSLLVFIFAVTNNEAVNIARVIGGRDAPNHKYPYQVSFRYKNGNLAEHFCGGSIINKHWILTAAHCLENEYSNIVIAAGTNYLNETGDEYRIYFRILHDNYQNFYHDDIALVRVQGEIKFSDHVKLVALAGDNLKTDYEWAVFTGWGSTQLAGLSPNSLQEIDLIIVQNDVCKKTLTTITSKHICTFTRPQEGPCHGDSGGPLVLNGYQVGIASYVTPCAVGEPDAYTRISKYHNWIEEKMQKFEFIFS